VKGTVKVSARDFFRTGKPPQTMPVTRAARELGISVQAVRKAIRAGRLRTAEIPVVIVRREVLTSAVRAYRPSAARIRAGRGRGVIG